MVKPKIHEKAWIVESAIIKGDVVVEEDVNIWYNAVVRGGTSKEQNAQIYVGEGSNIQDGCVIHVDVEYPTTIGKRVTVGHMTLLHGCTVGDDTLVGMGSVVLNGAKIGKNCMIGAGSLVTQNTEIPDGYLAFGRPAKPVRPLTEEELEHNKHNAKFYIEEAKEFYNEG